MQLPVTYLVSQAKCRGLGQRFLCFINFVRRPGDDFDTGQTIAGCNIES